MFELVAVVFLFQRPVADPNDRTRIVTTTGEMLPGSEVDQITERATRIMAALGARGAR